MTQEQTHTPGPWMLGENTPSELDQPIYANGTEGCVGICVVDLDEADEADANARLIAAAPDLLAACKKIVATHDIRDEHANEYEAGYTEGLGVASKIARDAIARAEGGAS
jgi:hypothetical protein